MNVNTPLSGRSSVFPSRSAARIRRVVPTPGSTTTTKMVPSDLYETTSRRNHAAPNTSNGAISCVRSSMRASQRAAITPFTAATYGSRVPKSVSSAIVVMASSINCKLMFETIPPPPSRLLVFARLPERGKVKTRLARDLGDDRTLALYDAMLRDLFANLGTPTAGLEIEVLWAPTESANGDALAEAFPGYALAMQSGDTLGDRLCMAFS